MNTAQVLQRGTESLTGLIGKVFDVLEVGKPVSPEAAINLTKIVSKLSPMVSNLIEFNTCKYLNDQADFKLLGEWQRQDPGFPDTVFISDEVIPTPGFEIKTWFPLASEITARFKDSQNHFEADQTHLAMLAWLPENLIFGKPKIIDIVVVSGKEVAESRDNHYHNPPDYLVIEPEDTTLRAINLQQTNTSGFKFQGTANQLAEAKKVVDSWGANGHVFKPTAEYQLRLRELIGVYPYRLDTNFAKLDRIEQADIEAFKIRVHSKQFHGKTIGQWNRLLSEGGEAAIKNELRDKFGIVNSKKPVVED